MDESAVFSVIFLTVISGWLAAVIVDYMYKEVGKCTLCFKKQFCSRFPEYKIHSSQVVVLVLSWPRCSQPSFSFFK